MRFTISSEFVDSASKSLTTSIIKSVILIAVCTFTNLLGILTSETANNLLLLDFAGTIAIAMIYGPIHAALVGIISTYIEAIYLPELISGFSSYRFKNYFLFAPAHMVIGMVVFLVPRMLKGNLATDVFNGNYEKYPAGRLLLSIIFLSLLTNLTSALTIATIMEIDNLGLRCSNILQSNIATYSLDLCKFTQLLFIETSHDIDYQFIKLTISKFIISFPDHLVCFSSAVVVIAYVLDARRYKMSHDFSKTIITNHPVVGAFYFLLFLFFVYVYTSHIYARAGMSAAFTAWTFYNGFLVMIALMIVSGRFNAWWFKPNRKGQRKYTYKKLNPGLKDAYEDSMKFAILYSVAIYFVISWAELQTNNEISKLFKDKLIGALGVVVVISLIRYLVLIIARVGRYLREFWYVKKPILG